MFVGMYFTIFLQLWNKGSKEPPYSIEFKISLSYTYTSISIIASTTIHSLMYFPYLVNALGLLVFIPYISNSQSFSDIVFYSAMYLLSYVSIHSC